MAVFTDDLPCRLEWTVAVFALLSVAGCDIVQVCYDDQECLSSEVCHLTTRLCVVRGCGNDVVEPDEVCDDGNTDSGDGCSGDCLSDETCGNGIIDVNEQCEYTTATTGCTQCLDDDGVQTCGNGVLEPGEQCDDGNTADADGCSEECLREFVCGDGICDVNNGESCSLCPQDCCEG